MGNLLQRHQISQLLVVHSVIWNISPGIVLNQRIHFAVLMSKSSFYFLGATKKWSKSQALGSNYMFKDGLAKYCTVSPDKCILKSFKFLANNLDINFTWKHCIVMITFLMFICKCNNTSCKLARNLLTGTVNRARVCYISSIFFIFSLRSWQQTLLLWQRNFYWLFQIKSFRNIIFGSVSDDTSVELETSVHWQCLMLYFLFLLYSSVFFSQKRTTLPFINPYLHGKLINWTSAFYLRFYCTVLPRILNI